MGADAQECSACLDALFDAFTRELPLAEGRTRHCWKRIEDIRHVAPRRPGALSGVMSALAVDPSDPGDSDDEIAGAQAGQCESAVAHIGTNRTLLQKQPLLAPVHEERARDEPAASVVSQREPHSTVTPIGPIDTPAERPSSQSHRQRSVAQQAQVSVPEQHSTLDPTPLLPVSAPVPAPSWRMVGRGPPRKGLHASSPDHRPALKWGAVFD